MGNGQDSAKPARSSVHIASYDPAFPLSTIEPASGTETTDFITLPENLPSPSSHYNNKQDGTFSYFDEYRAKAREKESLRQHNLLKLRLQQKHKKYQQSALSSNISRYNPINHPVIANSVDSPNLEK